MWRHVIIGLFLSHYKVFADYYECYDKNRLLEPYEPALKFLILITYEQRHEISNNVVCATSKASDQPAHMRSMIRAFSSHLSIL